MKTFSALLAICAGNSPVTGEFHAQRPVTRSFGVFFDLRPNERLGKQSWGWWFETPPRPLWRHCNVKCRVHNTITIKSWQSRSMTLSSVSGVWPRPEDFPCQENFSCDTWHFLHWGDGRICALRWYPVRVLFRITGSSLYFILESGPISLTWFNFNPSMDK